MTHAHKQARLDWCDANKNNDFHDYVFVDETSIWVNELPLYHMRRSGTDPETIASTTNSRGKLNVWGGISFRGATDVSVNKF